ncbi:MAG TPA: discoidin domain-containing protein [Vicinamibacterales bacterium]|nr:discoidin domain-containing protein [Vicinamibacterales bacterium]
MNLTRHSKTLAFATTVYVALTLAYSWPLAADLRHGIAHDAGDPILNAWILWWTTKAVPLTAHWWNAPIFYPATGAFAFSEHLLGLAPIAAPLIALTGNPLLGYNVTLLATYVLSALGAHYLAYALTSRHDAGFVAGIAYAFAPYRLAQVPHIQVLSAYWVPVCLAALHRYDREPRPRWAILAAGAWLMQALSCGYYMFFLSVLLALWMLWFAPGRWSLRSIAGAALTFGVAALLLAPILLEYQRILHDTYGFSRSVDEIRIFSADAAGLLLASEDLLLWGWLHVVQRPESALFPGLAVVLLAAFAIYSARPFAVDADDSKRMRILRAALSTIVIVMAIAAIAPIAYGGAWRLTAGGVRLISVTRADRPLTLAFAAVLALMASLPRVRAAIRCRSPLAFYVLAAFAMWMCALGPEPTVMDRPALSQAPYEWLMRIPGFDGLRVPARFWMMALACISVVSALAVNRLQGRARQIVVSLACAGLLLDGWPRTFVVVPAPRIRPSPAGVTSRIDLPISDDTDARALYQQVFDPIPLRNGFSGYVAPHYYALRVLIEESDPRILAILAANGPLGVVIDHAGDQDGRLRSFVRSYPGATVERSEPDWSSYRLPARPAEDQVPDRRGEALRIKALDAFPSPPHTPRAVDGDLRTRWSGGVQRAAADFTIELEQPTHVGQVVTDLGPFWTDFPRRLKIQVSPDGASWETAFLGDTALHTYDGALRHPREVPLVFAIDRDNVRFIRLQQLGWGTHDWSIAEVHVLK